MRVKTYPTVEEEDPVAPSRLDPGPAGEEPAAVGLRDDFQREPLRERGPRGLRAPVGRTIIDKDHVGRELGPAGCLDERVERGGQMGRLVVDGHDDAQRFAHRRAAKPRRKPATYAACVITRAGPASSPTATDRKRRPARIAEPATATPYAATSTTPVVAATPEPRPSKRTPVTAHAAGSKDKAVAELTLLPLVRSEAAPRAT